jgi:cystathionine gamma-synthase
VVTSSGLAAIDLVLAVLPSNALVVAPHDCYGGTWRLLEARARKGAIRVAYVDQNDPAALGAALGREPELLWIETPSNPLMRVVDVAALARLAKAAGARVAVDNTFLSPLLQKPITLGADFVVHSTTKYLNGHSDVVGGAVIAARGEDADELKWWANCCGVTGAPFDAWLTLRGLRTLSVRLERQQGSAEILAQRLTSHAGVARVHYPGLECHPGHRTARVQQSGFGAMLSLELGSPSSSAVIQVLRKLRRFTLAESLGGVESLVAHPATMTHASMSAEARAKAGIGEGLLRLSVGLEHVDDLWTDLSDALNAVPVIKTEPVKEQIQ